MMFYVYVDFRLDTNVPCYVGVGNEGRVKWMRRNKKHTAITEKHGIRRDVILSSREWDFVLQEEIKLIAELKTRDHFGGCNFTDGGEGQLGNHMSKGKGRPPPNKGVPMTEERKEHLRQKLKGHPPPNKGKKTGPNPKISAALTGQKQSTESIEKRANAHRGKKRAATAGPNISAAKLEAKRLGKRYMCSKCHQEGHNKRKCEQNGT